MTLYEMCLEWRRLTVGKEIKLHSFGKAPHALRVRTTCGDDRDLHPAWFEFVGGAESYIFEALCYWLNQRGANGLLSYSCNWLGGQYEATLTTFDIDGLVKKQLYSYSSQTSHAHALLDVYLQYLKS